MVLGDNRIEKNIDEGAGKCGYAITILSKNTVSSACAMEENSIIESRHFQDDITVFPVLYELSPNEIPLRLHWIKALIFKEVDRHSGTREICNHVACKITGDFASKCRHKNINDILRANLSSLPYAANALFHSYQQIDYANLNSRVALLYATYLTIIQSELVPFNPIVCMVKKIFERLFSETLLNLAIDYRELWLLENSICILVDYYLASCTESKM